jgi:hypothetical protein
MRTHKVFVNGLWTENKAFRATGNLPENEPPEEIILRVMDLNNDYGFCGKPCYIY